MTPGFRASSLALSAGLVAVWSEATVGSGGHSLTDYLAFFNGFSGAALIARLGFETLTLVAVVRGWRTLPVWLGGALVMLAASGHAAGVAPAWYGIGLDAVHLLAAGLWAGGIAALAVLRPPGGWRSSRGARPPGEVHADRARGVRGDRGSRRPGSHHPARVDPGAVRDGVRAGAAGQDGPGRFDAAAFGDGLAAQAAACPHRSRAGRRRGRRRGSALLVPDTTDGGRPAGGRDGGGDPGGGASDGGELTMAGPRAVSWSASASHRGRPGRIAPPCICSRSTEVRRREASPRTSPSTVSTRHWCRAATPVETRPSTSSRATGCGSTCSTAVRPQFTIPALPAPSGEALPRDSSTRGDERTDRI